MPPKGQGRTIPLYKNNENRKRDALFSKFCNFLEIFQKSDPPIQKRPYTTSVIIPPPLGRASSDFSKKTKIISRKVQKNAFGDGIAAILVSGPT
jgi:hypothetical protein